MTLKIPTTLCLSILIFLSGCNGDIFIDNYLPEKQNEFIISETNNSIEVDFKSDNWGLFNVFCETSDPYTANAYTINGEYTYFPLNEKELGIVHYKSNYIDVHVEKKSGNKLKVILNENLHNASVQMLIKVGNEVNNKSIKVILSPTQKYQIDSVVYDWDKLKVYESHLRRVSSINVNNQDSSIPITLTFFPFRESTREITFYDPTSIWNEENYNRLLGTPLPQITIPDIIDAKPVISDTKVNFGIQYQKLATTLDKDLSVDETVDGFTSREIVVYNTLRVYSVPYYIHMSNPRTGKELTFLGELSSDEPTDYLILKK